MFDTLLVSTLLVSCSAHPHDPRRWPRPARRDAGNHASNSIDRDWLAGGDFGVASPEDSNEYDGSWTQDLDAGTGCSGDYNALSGYRGDRYDPLEHLVNLRKSLNLTRERHAPQKKTLHSRYDDSKLKNLFRRTATGRLPVRSRKSYYDPLFGGLLGYGGQQYWDLPLSNEVQISDGLLTGLHDFLEWFTRFFPSTRSIRNTNGVHGRRFNAGYTERVAV